MVTEFKMLEKFLCEMGAPHEVCEDWWPWKESERVLLTNEPSKGLAIRVTDNYFVFTKAGKFVGTLSTVDARFQPRWKPGEILLRKRVIEAREEIVNDDAHGSDDG